MDITKDIPNLPDGKKKDGFVPSRPTYKGDGVAVWVRKDKNGKEYLSIKILNSITVVAFLPKASDGLGAS